jgi:hypothetical protein
VCSWVMPPRSGSAITHRGSESKGVTLMAGLGLHALRTEETAAVASALAKQQQFPHKPSSNV